MSSFARVAWAGRAVDIEYRWLEPAGPTARADTGGWMVFLHEGLGSLAMWRDFPQRLCDAIGMRALVYSRPGYGRSTPRAHDERWWLDFMHRQAHEVLPALFDALEIDPHANPPWLLGHSDGGSIALLHAARYTDAVAGLVVLAPHIVVEEFGLASIRQAREAYLTTDLKAKLARYHDDVDSAFWGWNDIWLDPGFPAWTIEEEIGSITCPVLAVQGEDDPYGTLEQIRGIARRLAQTRLLVLPDCGHSPHRDQTQELTRAVVEFVTAQTVTPPSHPSTRRQP